MDNGSITSQPVSNTVVTNQPGDEGYANQEPVQLATYGSTNWDDDDNDAIQREREEAEKNRRKEAEKNRRKEAEKNRRRRRNSRGDDLTDAADDVSSEVAQRVIKHRKERRTIYSTGNSDPLDDSGCDLVAMLCCLQCCSPCDCCEHDSGGSDGFCGDCDCDCDCDGGCID